VSWTFISGTGQWLDPRGAAYAEGYAGCGSGKNNPEAEDVHNVGPIPVGAYEIQGPPFTHAEAGPHTLRLEPMSATDTFGRAGFLIHGDTNPPGRASKGCPVLPDPAKRCLVWESGDHVLVVKAFPEDEPVTPPEGSRA
jgi:hypothetical protein